MATLFRGHVAEEDTFIKLEGEQPIPIGEDVLVSLSVFEENVGTLRSRNSGRLGVLLEAGEELESLSQHLDLIDLIGLDFPSFADGRSFSKARLLKEHHAFAGEVRAMGDIRIDQVGHMRRCGFDTMLITHAPTVKSLTGIKDPALSAHYQPAIQVAGAAGERAAGPRAWTRRTA
ncbi:MAG: DUF934 domain-containing protein [Pseudomonadota bacterium]